MDMDDFEYTARVQSTNDPVMPFAVVIVTNDGEEVARKWTRSEAEAQFFLEVLKATLELRGWVDEGGQLH
jgi:hypothetical protein